MQRLLKEQPLLIIRDKYIEQCRPDVKIVWEEIQAIYVEGVHASAVVEERW